MNPITFVSASAGSGKTWRVVTEVVAAITAGTLAPEALVATTFSRRAAASLRAALDRRLREAGRHDDARRLADARVGTVHSVCASLLGAFAHELGDPAGRRIAAPDAVASLLTEVLHEEVTDAELTRLDDLSTRLVGLDPWRDAASLVALARACGRDAHQLVADASASADTLDATLGAVGDGDAIVAALDRALARVPDAAVTPLVDAVRQRRSRGLLPPWSHWSRLASLDAGAAHDDALQPLRRAAAEHLRHPTLRDDLRGAVALVSSLAARALDPFEAKRRRAGVVDYLDLESLALRLLRRSDVRDALDGAFGLVVVDEFQDSSPLQLALFLELASLTPRSLWVGDLKQSIYAFRGADPALVSRVVAAVTPAGPPEVLATSWRSRGDLVSLTSGLFAPPFGAEGIPATHVALSAAHQEDGSLGPALERWRLPDGADRRAAAVARGVKALLDDPAVRVRDPRDGSVRRPRVGDLAVLARRHTRCDAIATALASLGVPCAYERAGLAATWEVRLALATLRLLVDADDRHAQAEVARLTAEHPDEDAWLLALLEGGGSLEALSAVAALRAAAQPSNDLVATWDRAVLAHGVRDRVRRWGNPEQRTANLDALRALLVRHVEGRAAEGRPVSVGAFLLALRALASKGDDRCAVSGDEAVTVVTWHASNGLEWPVVVLVDVDEESEGDAVFGAHATTAEGPFDPGALLATQRVTYWPSPYTRDDAGALGGLLSTGAAKAARERSARESLRELYVAFTRARDRVCLAAPSGRLTAGLMGLLRKDGAPLTPEPRVGKARWLRREWAVMERDPSGKPVDGLTPPDTVRVPAPGHRLAGPHAARWTKPSAQRAEGVVVAAEKIGAPSRLRASVDPRALGSLLHAWLASTVTGDAGEFLAAFGCEGALTAGALHAAREALRAWCDRRFPGATAYAECPVTRTMPDGSELRGSADLVLVTPDGVAVIDHKSHHGEGCDARAAAHWGQLSAYAEALGEALGRRVLGCFVHLPLAGRMVQIGAAHAANEREEGTAMTTEYHAKYWAQCLQQQRAQDDVSGLSRSIANARVDLNPHQIDAALFALRSPLSKGVLLADEVGLGKTIEAGIVLSQKWAERRRRILLITPATLRKQWQNELASKFFIDSVIVETKTVNDAKKRGDRDPLRRDDAIVIVSYEFAYARAAEIGALHWDLVVCDEAHRLRSVYKGTKKAVAIAKAIQSPRKLLLTATPLQNNLLELYGLVSILDEQVFGPQDSFTAQYVKSDDEAERNGALRDRLAAVCHRTLRRQVLEYIRFTKREALTLHFTPSEAEQALYDKVSEYLQREVLVALPTRQRKLITMVLRKLLASSSRAIEATLGRFVARLQAMRPDAVDDAATEALADYEHLPETAEEWGDSDEGEGTKSAFGGADDDVPKELKELKGYITLAASIAEDQKTTSLHKGLAGAFEKVAKLGAKRKAVIFTESVKTQEYLVEWLSAHGYDKKIVVMNGTNTDATSKRIYEAWKKKNAARWRDVSSGSRTADMKAAIVEAFAGDEVELLIATESAAEGVNLQFCSIVVNYDLPWNPQRVEQRIGRCHRYGQLHDVTVVNFVNEKNEADQRVYQLLDQKFKLFEGVFGASDDILGTIESGIDVERLIAELYERCRTREEIVAGFDALQARVDDQIRAAMADTRQKVLDHLDEEVHEKLKVHRDRAKETLAERERWLLDLCRHELGAAATFHPQEPRFQLNEGDGTVRRFSLRWPVADENGEEFLRSEHPFAKAIVDGALARPTPTAHLTLAWDARASALAPYRQRSGWLRVERFATESLERTESTLLLAAVTDDGAALSDDLARRLLTLPVAKREPASGDGGAGLAAEIERLRAAQRELTASRERQYLNEEELKLDTRIEDIRLGLEAEIKALDKDVTALRKASKAAKTLAEKVDAQKKIRAVEDRRDEKQRKLYDELKRYRGEHDAYIKTLEAQASARTEARDEVFTVRWTVA